MAVATSLFEIRNYHFNPELLEAYKDWVRNEAHPLLSKQLDIVGFWTSTGPQSEVSVGTPDQLGSPTVTWIVRFRDRAHRDETWAKITDSAEWKDVFSRVPGGPSSYARIESIFSESLF